VKEVIVVADDASLATLSFKPNFKTLGKRLGSKLKTVGKGIEALDRAQWGTLENGGTVTVDGEAIAKGDVIVTRTSVGAVVLESTDELTVALDTQLDEALKREGVLREALRAIQQARQETKGLEVSHRIHLTVVTKSATVRGVLKDFESLVRDEALVTGDFSIMEDAAAIAGLVPYQGEVEGEAISVYLKDVGA
jgi:isoleucyl-tRNA synthetase